MMAAQSLLVYFIYLFFIYLLCVHVPQSTDGGQRSTEGAGSPFHHVGSGGQAWLQAS